MRLISCTVEGFGRLRDVRINFTEGINCLVKENGWGKTTFTAFMRVMFYGFDGETKRNGFDNERRRYRPWSGDVYGGEILFEANGKCYKVQRTFGTKKAEDVCVIYDGYTNTISRDFSENIGEELFNIDAVSFAKSVYTSQNDCMTRITDSINAKIGNIALDSDDINNYEKAMLSIKNVLNVKSPVKRTGDLYKNKTALSEMRERARQLKPLETQIEQLRKKKDTLMEQKIHGDERCSRKREMDRAAAYFGGNIPDGRMLERMTDKAREYERLRMKYEADGTDALAEGKRHTAILWILCLVVMLLCAGMYGSIAAGFVRSGTGRSALYAIMLCLIFAMAAIVLHMRKKIRHSQAVLQNNMTKLSSFREELDNYVESVGFEPEEDLLSQMIRLKAKYDDYEEKRSCIVKTQGVKKAPDSVEEQIAACDLEMSHLREELADIKDMAASLDDMQRKLSEDLHTYELVAKTGELLEAARESFSVRHTIPVMKAFEKYYAFISKEMSGVRLDGDMIIKYKDQGLYRDIHTMSIGLQDLTGVCMRAALADVMFPGEKPVLIMDDPFVNLDDHNLEGAKKLLLHLSEKYQIIYFTCSKNRVI